MYILAVETTGPFGSVCLTDGDGNILAKAVSEDTMSHLKDLVPMMDSVIKTAGITKGDITCAAVSVGPGSFTGIRIGVSTVRAFAQALGIPTAAVPTLEAFLYKRTADTDKNSVRVPIINARRGQVYGLVEGYTEASACMLTDVLKTVSEKVLKDGKKVVFYGDGIDAYGEKIREALPEGSFSFAGVPERYQCAESAARLALRLVKEGKTTEFGSLMPEYMRKAEAEQKLEAGELPICKGPEQE